MNKKLKILNIVKDSRNFRFKKETDQNWSHKILFYFQEKENIKIARKSKGNIVEDI